MSPVLSKYLGLYLESVIFQIFLGTRLPIIQSGSYIYFAVAAGIMAKDKCAESYEVENPNKTAGERKFLSYFCKISGAFQSMIQQSRSH